MHHTELQVMMLVAKQTLLTKRSPMRIRTLLNSCQKYKSFIYKTEYFEKRNNKQVVIIEVEERKNSHPICSCCQQKAVQYDRLPYNRDDQFIPLWGYQVYIRYRKRRVNCLKCGVKVEQVPWSQGKQKLTSSYQVYLAQWARRVSWKEVSEVFQTSWYHVYQSVKFVVSYGLKKRNLDNINAIGVDEVQYGKGHQYITLVYQLDSENKRLLFVGKNRKAKTLLRFFHQLGKSRCANIKFVCSDMWKAYLKVIKKKIPQACHILDRFHIVAMLNKAVDEVRRTEAKQLKADGYEDILKHTKYCFLKNEENLTEKQSLKLDDVLQYDMKSIRAYLYKESFQAFWKYKTPYWAEWFLTKWCNKAMRSQLKPIKRFVKTVRNHQPLMMNWFKAKKQYSSGTVEGFNRKVNLVTRKAYGFRHYETLEIALFHTMGKLPEPESTHRFF